MVEGNSQVVAKAIAFYQKKFSCLSWTENRSLLNHVPTVVTEEMNRVIKL